MAGYSRRGGIMAENYRRQDNLGETGHDLLGFTDIAGRLADVGASYLDLRERGAQESRT
jgi:hypothetical protein